MFSIGIDLGTTNSLIAYFKEDKPVLIPNVLGEILTPSVVGIDDDGTILVGRIAKERLLTHPTLTIATFKRLMGTGQTIKLGKHSFRPEELSAFVLRQLKQDGEAHLGIKIDKAIISVPAYFNDHQRRATMDAGKLAGLVVERVINEPTAAALAYGLNEREDGKFLVFDLGGGTFDVSILDKYDGVMEVRATTGDTRLGGEDFTQCVADIITRKAEIIPHMLDMKEKAKLYRTAEKVKTELGSKHEASFSLELTAKTIEGAITRQMFEDECLTLMRRLRSPLERAVSDSAIDPDDLDAIVMVGGATRMPFVRSMVARLFGKLPMVHIDPDTAIALGAAVQAGLHDRHAALDDIVMTDVCPFSLGLAIQDSMNEELERMSVLIPRNATVPVSNASIYNTVSDNQTQIFFKIYQGENLRPENNVFIGQLDMTVPKMKAGEARVDVRFTYDINGALEVIATELSKNKVVKDIFKNNSGLSHAELEARFKELEAIKLHPREYLENKTLLARAERVYAEARFEDKERIAEMMGAFEALLKTHDKTRIDKAILEMNDALDWAEKTLDVF